MNMDSFTLHCPRPPRRGVWRQVLTRIAAGQHAHTAAALAVLAAALLPAPGARAAFQTLDDPQVPMGQIPTFQGTFINSASNGAAVGRYVDSGGNQHGFTYNYHGGSGFATLDVPGAVDTLPFGTDGTNIVGYYEVQSGGGQTQHGFLYNGSTFATLDDPNDPTNTVPRGVSGSTVVGFYGGAPNSSGFVYNGSTFSTLNAPGQEGTQPFSVDGSTIVGDYIDPVHGSSHGFTYDGSFHDVVGPGGVALGVLAISGNVIGGQYTSGNTNHGFVYDGTTFLTVDAPNSSTAGTAVTGIVGNTVYGFYFDRNFFAHGFETTVAIPEPSSLAGLGLLAGVAALARRRRRGRTRAAGTA